MVITKQILVDKIEVLEMGQIQIRQATKYIEDGKEVSKTFHRHAIAPDHADITDQDERVQAIANAVWTPEVKQAWEDFKASQEVV